jgi:hypothetical protein
MDGRQKLMRTVVQGGGLRRCDDAAMPRGLLIIDIQRDYFPGGANPLVGPDHAATVAQRVLGAFRTAGEPVVHLQHVWDAEDATFMRPGTGGVEIDPRVAPTADETVIESPRPTASSGQGSSRNCGGPRSTRSWSSG